MRLNAAGGPRGTRSSVARGAATPSPARAARPAGRFARDLVVQGTLTYVVMPGDTLKRIARATLGSEDRWRELWDANRDDLPDPRMLYPGQALQVPGRRRAPAPAPLADKPAAPPDPAAVARFLRAAQAFLGQPFRWGGGHVPRALAQPVPVDGSGLVQQAARAAGAQVDGTAAEQQRLGRAVALDALAPGDLLFQGEPARHVGIHLGDGQVLHASSRAGRVVIEPIGADIAFDTARRVF